MKKLFYLMIIIIFIVVFLFSLTFVYVEGDDATIISYQLFGSNEAVQARHGNYQAMFDVLFSLFPPNETFLRIFSITLSALAACFFTILAVNIVFKWMPVNTEMAFVVIPLILLLTPELFFSGLYINPTLISLVLALLSHLLLKGKYEKKFIQGLIFLISGVLFGLSISFRWNIIFYGVVIFMDLAIDNSFMHTRETAKISKHQVMESLIWAAISSISGFIFILLSLGDESKLTGFTFLPSFVNTYLISDTFSFSLISIAKMMTLFSPILILFSAIGLYSFGRKKAWKFILIFFVQLLSISLFIKVGFFKETLIIIPITWLLFVEGIHFSAKLIKPKLLLPIVFLISAVPWFIGIKVYSNSTLWGPGFEIRSPTNVNDLEEGVNIVFSPTLSFSLGLTRLDFDAGFALTTSEGPRPLGGYFYVLIGGQWRTFMLEWDYSIKEIAHLGIQQGAILQVGSSSTSRIFNEFFNAGYIYAQSGISSDHETQVLPNKIFSNLSGNTTRIYYLGRGDLKTQDLSLDNFDISIYEIPLHTNYSSELNELFIEIPKDRFRVLSPFTGILSLP